MEVSSNLGKISIKKLINSFSDKYGLEKFFLFLLNFSHFIRMNPSGLLIFVFLTDISNSEYESVEDIVSATEDILDTTKKGRWYDLDSTVRTAITLLQNCPEATRSVIAKEMAKNVIEIIKKEEDEDDESEETDE